MSLAALNRWRWVYLAEAMIGLFAGGQKAVRGTLLLGAALWLAHDLAHGRWRVAIADALALGAFLAGCVPLAVAAAAYAALNPEQRPSRFVWARRETSA